jgi:hypothetical protein
MTTRPDESVRTGADRVQAALKEARRRWLLAVWLRIAAEAVLVAVVALLAAWSVSRLVTPSPAGLLLLGAAVVAVTAGLLMWRSWPFWRRPSARRVARFVEERVPELEEVLVTAVDCLERPSASPLSGPLLADAGVRVEGLDADRVVSSQMLRTRTLQLAGAAVLLIGVVVALRDPLLKGFDVLRMVVAPPRLTFDVSPGDVSVREGSDFRIRARVLGLPARLPLESLTLTLEAGAGARAVSMEGRGEWQETGIDDARDSFSYRVSGYGLTSRAYRIDVRPRPRVARIDVHYDYPAFTGLAPRLDEDAGDVYAPAGTTVRLIVHTTVPVSQAGLSLASGAEVGLAATASRTLEGTLVVTGDDSYRVALVDGDGVRTPDDTEYFVRTVDDRPPDVRIVRPAGDRRVTRLEEVVIEAQADDDFGIDRLELVYAARGSAERVVRLGGKRQTTASGRYTMFVEDLDVQPGDFVSYYARARDVGRGKRPTEARSDIFFLEVRPFNEEFEAAQSSAMGEGGGAIDDLAARQKELIIATWKLERRSGAGRSPDDIKALARAQRELKTKAEQLAARLAPRGVQRRQRVDQPGGLPPGPASGAPHPLRQAVDAMERSAKALDELQTGAAIPHEMDALNQLLRAQADVQRRQVAQQQSASGRGGQTGNQDLSALFDRELQRQQETKYENRSSAETRQGADDESEALDRLRELARRQDELTERQRELARQRAQLDPEEVKRQLERLTREQEELRRQAEQLAAQEPQQQGGTQSQQSQAQSSQEGSQPRGSGDGRALQEAAAAMARAAGGLERSQLGEAASQAEQAAERLREAERSMARQQPDETRRAAGDLQLEAAQLAEEERRVARQLRQSGVGADQLRQLAGEQDRAADRASRLADRAAQLVESPADRARDGAAGATAEAASETRLEPQTGRRVASQLREAARSLRDMAERGGAGEGSPSPQREAERADSLARALEGLARDLGRTAGREGDRPTGSDQLARAGELRERLEELTRQLREGRSPSGAQQPAGTAPSGETSSARQARDTRGQSSPGSDNGGPTSSSSDGRQPGEASGDTADGVPGPEEIARELRALERLADRLGEDGDALRHGLQRLEGVVPSRSAPGTEPFKQDFSRWESLRREISQAIEVLEARLSKEITAAEKENRLESGASDAAPDDYRREVANYYRSLARKPQP